MEKIEINISAECPACGGTGLYAGMAERDGAAVVCYRCGGTGCKTITYTPFTERKRKVGIKRVYEWSNGIGIGEDASRGISLEDFGGMPYKDWADGKPFELGMEDRKHVCPAWHVGSTSYTPGCDEKCLRLSMRFSDCQKFGSKHECWKEYDKAKKGSK